MAKCCYYEKKDQSGRTKTICTSDGDCPVLAGWDLIGSWSVESCDVCFRSADTDEGEGTGDGGSIDLGEIHRVRFPPSFHLSRATLAALEKHVGGGKAPDDCELRVTLGKDGSMTYDCIGGCPKGQICALKFEKKGGDLIITCDCQ